MGDPGAWLENDRLRTEASAAIADAAQAAGAQRLVQESLAFIYVDGGDAWVDEDAPLATVGPTATALPARTAGRRWGTWTPRGEASLPPWGRAMPTGP